MSDVHLGRQPVVLLVEDNPGDVRLTIEALKEGGVSCQLEVARDGVDAMAFLRQEGPFVSAPRPDLVLLDLNLPKKSGFGVLAEIKADDRLRRIPVMVLTTSEIEDDVARSYDLHANCYIVKPVSLDHFIEVARSVQDFWFTVVRLPGV